MSRLPDPERRWLLTNGIGGYASGALDGGQRHRYDGLLIAALRPPVQRILAWHSVIEFAQSGPKRAQRTYTRHAFGNLPTHHPDGIGPADTLVERSNRDVTWQYRSADLSFTRRLDLTPDRNRARLTYAIVAAQPGVTFLVRPLTPLRDFHVLDTERDDAHTTTQPDAQMVTVQRAGIECTFHADAGRWHLESQWWRQLAYVDDRTRGQQWREDVYSPGVLEVPLQAGRTMTVTITADVTVPAPRPASPEASCNKGVATPDQATRISNNERDTPRAMLTTAADQFVVRRLVRQADETRWATTILAGYPWFADWGRDAMIALPGLLLTTGRRDAALDVLRLFASHIKDGLIPNRFDDYDNAAHYNTVDASLWFIRAVGLWAAAGDDSYAPHAHLPADLLDAMRAIISAYYNGTRFDIRATDDGLITAGNATTQLTWMDAQRDGVTFTPRYGKPVEVNALWHHALHVMARWSTDEDERSAMQARADQVAASFRQAFWWADRQCCHDVLVPQSDSSTFVADGTFRPNQIFAVALQPSPLSRDQQRSVVHAVRDRLLTPYGLRTLDPADPGYRGRFEGDLCQRDAAYHQGTVWPWLIGPYVEATLLIDDFSETARAAAHRALQPLLRDAESAGGIDRDGRGCIGQIAEVYDGNALHRPGGCYAQAWSVAEVLRAMTLSEHP